jgi:hypothetical protein
VVQTKYPKARPWFHWWLKESTGKLIFKSMQSHLNPDFAKAGRTDTNPIEAMHAAYYQIAERNNTLVFGLSSLMIFASSLELEYNDLLQGRSIRYGLGFLAEIMMRVCEPSVT